MNISEYRYEEIRQLHVDEYKVSCEYSYWEEWFKGEPEILAKIFDIKKLVGKDFGRAEIVCFYGGASDVVTKFLLAMIWGHEAPEGSRRDTRGPWKVEKMLKSSNLFKTLSKIIIDTDVDLQHAYSSMRKSIDRCGPSFITKHLYFLGKSSGSTQYPLIFDDRVAIGLAKLSLRNSICLDFISIHALTKSKAYMRYLEFARNQSALIGCELDKIEYFLFKSGG